MIRRRNWALYMWLSALPLLGFWLYGLFDLDEGFYAAISQEMLRRGEWITPYLNGQPWFEKPILIYWSVIPSLALFGGEFGLRLPSVLATLGLYAVCSWFATKRISPRAGQWTIIVLASGLLIPLYGRMVMTDAIFNFVLTCTFLSFIESLYGDRRWRIVSAFFLGLSALAKGPVGCVIFVAVAVYFLITNPELREKYRGWWLVGIVVFTLVVASWYVPVYLANRGAFVDQFLVAQNVGRFQGGDKAHKLSGPSNWFFYIPILLVGFAPWFYWIFPAWKAKKDNSILRYLAIWATAIFIFFTLSGAKLPHYILPMVPPLGLLVASLLASREKESKAGFWRKEIAPNSGFGMTIGMVAPLVITGALLFTLPEMYYNGVLKGTPNQREIHKMVRSTVSEFAGKDVQFATFQLGRQNKKDLGTGKLKIQETDLPSLQFYLNAKRPIIRANKVDELLHNNEPVIVFTRSNRFTPEVLSQIKVSGYRAVQTSRGEFYAEWRIYPPQR